jgi:hypothetical protein
MIDQERKNRQFVYIELIILGAVIVLGITQLVVYVLS